MAKSDKEKDAEFAAEKKKKKKRGNEVREEQTLRQDEKRQLRTTWQHWGKSSQAFPKQLHTL